MWSWLAENHGAVSAVASCLTLVVWLLYFQLLYLGFRQTQRANILITVAGGPSVVTSRLLPRRFRFDASDEFLVVDEGMKEVAPCVGGTTSIGKHLP